MEFAEAVRKRRMVRHFQERPVAWPAIERIIRTAQHAPSAGFTQGVSYVAVTDATTREQIASIAGEEWYARAGHHRFISEAPAHVVVCTSQETYEARYREPDKQKKGQAEKQWPVPYWYLDAGCALMLVLLAAVDEGLAAAFVGVRDPLQLSEALGIPPGTTPIGVVLIGYPGVDKPSRSLARGRRPLDQVLHRERWQDG